MKKVQLGLLANWRQFSILVVVNAFVGGMIGLERSILPLMAEIEFAIAAKTAMLSFIVVFGIVKALSNYYAGLMANKIGRKNLLILGWVFAIPVPFILMYAGSWNWIIFANILLGVNQGLAWSSTVVMKIDLVGERQRGFAMGLNEFAGYLAVALVAFFTGWIAGEYGVRPYPFYIGIGLMIAGLLMSIFLVKDTRAHVSLESESNNVGRLKNIFRETTWTNKNLGSITQAGLVNNLNDGMIWGIFPLLLASKFYSLEQIGLVVAVYPAVWGIGQLFTGKLADVFLKKQVLFVGMFLQALALFGFVMANDLWFFVILSVILGFGTAMAYPTFLAAVAENTNPQDRAESIGIFRLWRDLGYAFGAIITGIVADALNMESAILLIALLTLVSSFIILFRMENSKDKGKGIVFFK